MVNKAVEQAVMSPFFINQKDGNITEADGTADTWSDIWKYQVPQGSGIVLEAGNTFAAYLEDAAAEVGNYDCYIRIEVRDPSEQDRNPVYGPGLYIRSKEFQNRAKIARLSVGAPVKVYSRQWIVISVKDNGAIDASNSYFELLVGKVAVPLL